MFDRLPEREGLFETLAQEGVGCIVISPLGQGLLTNRYLSGLPPDARAIRDPRFLRPEDITASRLQQVRALDSLARRRDQSLD